MHATRRARWGVLALASIAVLGHAVVASSHSDHQKSTGANSPAVPVPREGTIYKHHIPWFDERGEAVSLDEWSGSRVLLSLFYTNCRSHVCSVALELLKEMDRSLARDSARLPIVLVTLDQDWDDPKRLALYKRGYDVDENWHLLVGDESATRALTSFLGYDYVQTGPSEIIHPYAIYVLDAQGRIEDVIRWGTGAQEAVARLGP